MGGRRYLKLLGALVASLLLCIGAAAGGWTYFKTELAAPGPLPSSAAIVVPRGGSDAVAGALAGAQVIDSSSWFRIAVFLTRDEGPLHAGEYAFPAHASLRTTLTILRSARPIQHHLTIPEGLTARQIAGLLDRAEATTGNTPLIPEGRFLPDTYIYEYGAARASLVERGGAAMDRALQQAWIDRAPDLPLSSARDALILASIIERETARPDERPHIASVFINRLRLGMKLQSDPTVVYAASDGRGTLDRPISRSDLDRDSPFNTYRIYGLPQSPICAPGVASLQAATHPAQSSDLYFVADGTGGHVFSRTLDDHLRNVARWRALGSAPIEVR